MSKKSAYFEMDSVSGKHDLKQIKSKLEALHGVISVSVNVERNSVAVDFDSTGTSDHKLVENLNGMGFNIVSKTVEDNIM